MIRTFKIKYVSGISESDSFVLDNYFREQGSCIRSCYKMISSGFNEKQIREKLKTYRYDHIDTWFIQSAIYQAKCLYESNISLGITKNIFGGKSNFIKRSQNKINKEEFKNNRNKYIISVGEAPKKANRKFNFFKDYIEFKPNKNVKIRFDLPCLKKNARKLYNNLVSLSRSKSIPIQVKIDRDGYLHLSYNHSTLFGRECKKKEGTVAGIDLNPNYIGISILDVNNNYRVIKSKLFSLKKITNKKIKDSKLDHETIEIAHDIGTWLKNEKVEYLFLEQLKFNSGSDGKGKNFNRLVKNKWKRDLFVSILEKHFKINSVNAAYSSTIGNILNDAYADPVASSIEIGRRGYECFIKKSGRFYPDLVSLKRLNDRWKETEFPEIKSWKELHAFLKNSKMMYRVPVTNEQSFRKFKTIKSLVLVI